MPLLFCMDVFTCYVMLYLLNQEVFSLKEIFAKTILLFNIYQLNIGLIYKYKINGFNKQFNIEFFYLI